MTVIDFEETLPHLVIRTLDGNVTVVPVAMFTDLVAGRLKETDIENWEMLRNTIIMQWLDTAEEADE